MVANNCFFFFLHANVFHVLHYLKYALRREPLAHCYNTAKLFLLSIRLLHLSQSVPTGSAVGLLTPFHSSLIFHPPYWVHFLVVGSCLTSLILIDFTLILACRASVNTPSKQHCGAIYSVSLQKLKFLYALSRRWFAFPLYNI